MSAGRFRDRVTLQAPADGAPDAIGQRPDAWTDVGDYWAEVRALSGRQAELARQTVAESTHKAVLRDVGSEITPRHRLIHHGRWGDRTLNVVDAPFDAKARIWSLLCQGDADADG